MKNVKKCWGFGDIVPQKKSHLFVTLLYIVTGLIICTMCIDLVGSQYIRKIHYFGRNIRKARYAIASMGDKVLHIGEIIRYVAFLQKRYGLTQEDLEKLSQAPDEFLLECLLKGRPLPPHWQALFSKPFIPADWHLWKWIEQKSTNSYCSEKLLASLESTDVPNSARSWHSLESSEGSRKGLFGGIFKRKRGKPARKNTVTKPFRTEA